MTAVAALSNASLEASVLGGVFHRPELLGRLDLEVEDFALAKHQAVFVAMRTLDEREDAIEPVLVETELRRAGRLDAVGGLAYLGELMLLCATPGNVERYARELRGYRARREIAAILADALGAVREREETSADEVLGHVLARLASVRTNTADPTESLGALMHREAERIERDLEAQARGERVGGMPTGLDRLDALTGGVPLGVTTVVLGETGHGKSTLGMSFARASADLAHDEPLVLSYEDGRRSYAQRGLAQESGVPTQVIRRRSFRPGEERRVLVEGLRRAGLRRERIARVRGMGVDELCTLVRRTRAKGPRSPGARTAANLVVVDYLQAMPRPQGRAIRAEHEALGEIARRLEDLAATEECAVVVFSQVNDECAHREDHRPRLRDVAGGRDLVKGAKLVLGLYRPWLYDAGADPHAGEILVLKNNDGETRRAAHVHLDLATHTIRDAAPASMPPATQLALGGEPP